MRSQNDYHNKIFHRIKSHEKLIVGLRESFDAKNDSRNAQIKSYNKNITKSIQNEKSEYEKLNEEIFRLYKISKENDKLIKYVEDGNLHNGIKMHYIPSKDKISSPSKESYKLLYQIVNKHKYNSVKCLPKPN